MLFGSSVEVAGFVGYQLHAVDHGEDSFAVHAVHFAVVVVDGRFGLFAIRVLVRFQRAIAGIRGEFHQHSPLVVFFLGRLSVVFLNSFGGDSFSITKNDPADRHELHGLHVDRGVDTAVDIAKESADIINRGNTDYEFRTTVVEGLLTFDSFVKINDVFKRMKKIKRYYLQKFQKSKHIDKTFIDKKTFSDDEFLKLEKLFKNTTEFFMVR